MYVDGGCLYSSISVKQVNVIFRNNKLGNINIKDSEIKVLYDLAKGKEYYRYGGQTLERIESRVFKIVKSLFANDFVDAQGEIDLLDKRI